MPGEHGKHFQHQAHQNHDKHHCHLLALLARFLLLVEHLPHIAHLQIVPESFLLDPRAYVFVLYAKGHRQHLVVLIRYPVLPHQLLPPFFTMLPQVDGLLQLLLRYQQSPFQNANRLHHRPRQALRFVVLGRVKLSIVEELLGKGVTELRHGQALHCQLVQHFLDVVAPVGAVGLSDALLSQLGQDLRLLVHKNYCDLK